MDADMDADMDVDMGVWLWVCGCRCVAVGVVVCVWLCVGSLVCGGVTTTVCQSRPQSQVMSSVQF